MPVMPLTASIRFSCAEAKGYNARAEPWQHVQARLSTTPEMVYE